MCRESGEGFFVGMWKGGCTGLEKGEVGMSEGFGGFLRGEGEKVKVDVDIQREEHRDKMALHTRQRRGDPGNSGGICGREKVHTRELLHGEGWVGGEMFEIRADKCFEKGFVVGDGAVLTVMREVFVGCTREMGGVKIIEEDGAEIRAVCLAEIQVQKGECWCCAAALGHVWRCLEGRLIVDGYGGDALFLD